MEGSIWPPDAALIVFVDTVLRGEPVMLHVVKRQSISFTDSLAEGARRTCK